ncbi:MAG: hypothetical protein ACP5MK_00695 [Candidatus Micrarchaeia archaeon]
MPKYYKIWDSKETIYVTIDDSGAAIIKDAAGRKVFLSRYQTKLMKFGIENFLKQLVKGDGEVHVEQIDAIDD